MVFVGGTNGGCIDWKLIGPPNLETPAVLLIIIHTFSHPLTRLDVSKKCT